MRKTPQRQQRIRGQSNHEPVYTSVSHPLRGSSPCNSKLHAVYLCAIRGIVTHCSCELCRSAHRIPVTPASPLLHTRVQEASASTVVPGPPARGTGGTSYGVTSPSRTSGGTSHSKCSRKLPVMIVATYCMGMRIPAYTPLHRWFYRWFYRSLIHSLIPLHKVAAPRIGWGKGQNSDPWGAGTPIGGVSYSCATASSISQEHGRLGLATRGTRGWA
jgi:hypothetical protein